MKTNPLKNPATEALAQELAALLPDKSAANARFAEFANANPGLKKWEAAAIAERVRDLHENPEPAPFPYPAAEDRIPAEIKRTRIGINSDRLVYACPDACWRSHVEAWRRTGHTGPEPFPFAHVCFNQAATA